jgi:hypothetical protein
VEFDTLILLLAAGYALLQWMIRGVRKAAEQAGGQDTDTGVEQAELEVRRRQRLEQLKARRQERIEARRQRTAVRSQPAPAKTAQERQVEQFQRTLEQLLGVRTGPEAGPLGRRGGVELEPAEEIEDIESHDLDEPVVVSLETGDERAARVIYDQDTDAETLVQRRIAAGQARSGALTRADHSKFDQKIRTAGSEPIQVHRTRKARRPGGTGSIRDAFVWTEILGPPVGRR